jgi:hypothetical protein
MNFDKHRAFSSISSSKGKKKEEKRKRRLLKKEADEILIAEKSNFFNLSNDSFSPKINI